MFADMDCVITLTTKKVKNCNLKSRFVQKHLVDGAYDVPPHNESELHYIWSYDGGETDVWSQCSEAQEIYRLSQGRQQVLPLDSIYQKTLPEWDKLDDHFKDNNLVWRNTCFVKYFSAILQFHFTVEPVSEYLLPLLTASSRASETELASRWQPAVCPAHAPVLQGRRKLQVRQVFLNWNESILCEGAGKLLPVLCSWNFYFSICTG